MIPTTYKAKLPKSLAYPVQASVLSEALVGVPQFDELSVSFHHHPFNRASEFADVIRSGRPYAIVRARFHRTPLGMSECTDMAANGLYGPRWYLWVYAVPSDVAGDLRREVAERGLPQIREWLMEPRSEAWRQRSHQCDVLFSTTSGTLTLAPSAGE